MPRRSTQTERLARYGDLPEFRRRRVAGTTACLFMIVAREYQESPGGLDSAKRRQGTASSLLPLHIWYYLLWYDPSVTLPDRPRRSIPQGRAGSISGTYDLFFMRSGWG